MARRILTSESVTARLRGGDNIEVQYDVLGPSDRDDGPPGVDVVLYLDDDPGDELTIDGREIIGLGATVERWTAIVQRTHAGGQ